MLQCAAMACQPIERVRPITNMLVKILSIVFPIFAIVVVGYVYGLRHKPDMQAATKINMDLFVPALVLWALASKDFQLARYSQLALAASAVVLGSGVLAWPVARLLRVQVNTFVPPMMFNNSGNMGIPLILLALGMQALPGAIILFLVEMLLHFCLGLYMLDHRARIAPILRQPVMLASMLGLVISFSGWPMPEPLTLSIKMLGDMSVPLMLFTLGVRMTHVSLDDWKIGVIGGLLCPLSGLAIAAVCLWVWPLPAEQRAMLWLFAALPPAVLNYLVAEQYGQEPARVASVVLLGNLLSLVVIPATLLFALPGL